MPADHTSDTKQLQQLRRAAILQVLERSGPLSLQQIEELVDAMSDDLGVWLRPELSLIELNALETSRLVVADRRRYRTHIWRLAAQPLDYRPEGRPQLSLLAMPEEELYELLGLLVLAIVDRLGEASYHDVVEEVNRDYSVDADVVTCTRVITVAKRCEQEGLLERTEHDQGGATWRLVYPECWLAVPEMPEPATNGDEL